MLNRRRLTVAAVLLAAVLLVLVGYPGTFVGPIDEDPFYEHRIEPTSSEAYEERIATFEDRSRDSEEDLREVRYDELSPGGQALFDRTAAVERDSDGTRDYRPTVCKAYALYCPGLRQGDLPREFSYEYDADFLDSAVIVETDDGRHLFSAAAHSTVYPHGDPSGVFRALLSFLTLAPFATFLLAFSTGRAIESRSVRAAGSLTCVVLAGIAARTSSFVWTTLTFVVCAVLLVPFAVPTPAANLRLRALAIAVGAFVAALSVVPSHLSTVTSIGPNVVLVALVTLSVSWIGMASLSVAAYLSDSPSGPVGSSRADSRK